MIRDKRHLDFIRSLECVLCASPYVEAAHLRMGTDGGMGMKPSDSFSLPLCSAHHRCQHHISEPKFWEEWEPHALAEKLWLSSGSYDEAIGHIEKEREEFNARRKQVESGTFGEGEDFSFSPIKL